VISSPPFGQADLTNCERELIHLAGSVQPHGLFLAVRAEEMTIAQVSANASTLLGVSASSLCEQPLGELGGDIDAAVRRLAASGDLTEPMALRCRTTAGGQPRELEGTVYRLGGLLLVEIEPILAVPSVETVDIEGPRLVAQVEAAVQRISMASTIDRLADAAVRSFRDLVGYDRVMVYKFDPDGHGMILAEARDPRLESLLGHHYPATDIPQRARELYLRNKLRVLVDVHYTPAALEPRRVPGSPDELDMSMSYLRSMSPLHLQYLKNMGVTATLVVSLVREGKLWGLVACHHYSPRNLRLAVRAAADLMAEVVSTRLAAIESYAQAQVAIQVRRLEQRLVEATSTEGDWRMALLRNPRTLLQPLDATGAALFYEGEVLTAGDVPSTPQLRAMMEWVSEQTVDGFYACSSISRANPKLESLTPTASGILAVRLSTSSPEYLMWFRREQLQTLTWAGDPSKPMISDDPLELSPRRSFAAWSEIVRGTAVRWSEGEIATARAFGVALVDIIVQINAVRLLIAEHQIAEVRAAVARCKEAVVILDPRGTVLFANDVFRDLARRTPPPASHVADLFVEPEGVRQLLRSLSSERQSWRGECELLQDDGLALPVAVRAEVVPARNGSVMGFFLIVDDLTEVNQTAAARRRLEEALVVEQASLATVEHQNGAAPPDRLMSAILANASLAAMDIADAGTTPSAVPLLRELEASAHRASALYRRIRDFTGTG
jgi:two-component system, chemotaxis family, sensor kinase Cph1